jgi:branched-chain amino acid aminotransferase
VKEHFKRLKQTCAALGISYDFDIFELIDRTYELLEKNRLRNAYLRVFVTSDPSLIITANEWNFFMANNPLKLTVSKYERPNPKSMPAGVKIASNAMHSKFTSTTAKAKGFDDALLLDMNGHVAQSSSANIFIQKGSKIYTPAIGHIFAGITRSIVFEICASLNIEVIEKEISLEELQQADSAFLCGTRTEITGVASIDSLIFPVDWENTIGATVQRIFINRVLEQENYEVII